MFVHALRSSATVPLLHHVCDLAGRPAGLFHACRCRGAAAVPARGRAGAVRVERHGRRRPLPDPGGLGVGALQEQGLQGVRAAVAGQRVRRRRQARRQEGGAAQVPQVLAAPRRAAGALLRRQLHVRAGGARQVLASSGMSIADSGRGRT